MPTFSESVKENFKFLETDYGFQLLSCQDTSWGGNARYINDTTGVKIVYEIPCGFVFVFIYKLIDGEMVDNPRPIEKDSTITCFDFTDAVPEKEKMKPAHEYGVDSCYYDEEYGLYNYIKEFSERLKKYGHDVLNGDFSILPKVEKIIKSRKESS